ncbi:MAG: deoxyribonuclease V [Candidatus Eisenbacteria bacterium]|uniref:Endonuclease V n=1 Tax=Eiseniibacteriota bacterium TaxID=2212470 RepID=A0A948S0N0_UNCEI|nr:deoxyribonuclease V [Candidatus Eisenbacteria bacterium]MBU1949636.1 deoxyribonuclease V [Candidatus Eisenbacteria bacterium]MBU2693029.1 deoxyribonuclease V [Candidatus Eisenbacteria bacterium]
MKPRFAHPWNLSTPEAVKIQERLRQEVSLEGSLKGDSFLVAGLDVATNGHRFHSAAGEILYAAVVLLDWPSGEMLEEVYASLGARFPYIPGLLSFREIPVLQQALEQLSRIPDLIVCDGQGIAHPRRFGLACHLGVLYDIPSLGIAKSLLCGAVREPDRRRGGHSPIRLGTETVGYAVRTRDNVRPVYVSPGHRLSLQESLRLTLALHGGFRIPRPTRLADQKVKQFKNSQPRSGDG